MSTVVLIFGGFPQNPYQQLPKGHGHFVLRHVADGLGPDFYAYLTALVLSASLLFLTPKHLMPYVWMMLVLIGVIGGVSGIALAWLGRRKQRNTHAV